MRDQTSSSTNKRSFLSMQDDAPEVIQTKPRVQTSALSQTCRQGNKYFAIRRKSSEKIYGGEGANEENHDDSCIFESWNSAKKHLDATNVKVEYETFRSLEKAVLYAFGKSRSGSQLQCTDQENMEVEGLLAEEPSFRSTCKATTLSAFELLPQEILNAIYSYICWGDEVDREMLDYSRVYSFLCKSMRSVSKKIYQSSINFVQQVPIGFHTALDPSSDSNKMDFFQKNKARVGAVCVGAQYGSTSTSRMIVSLFTLKFLDISSMKQLELMARALEPPNAGQLWNLAKHGGVPLEFIRENEGLTLEDFYSIIYNRLVKERNLSLQRLEVRVNAKIFEAFHRFITSHAKNQLVYLWVEINLVASSSIELSSTIRKIERVVEKAPCLEQLRLDIISSGNDVHDLCLNSSSLRSLQLGDPEEAYHIDDSSSQYPLFCIGENVNCPRLTALEMTIPHLGNPFDPFVISEGRTFATIEDLTLTIAGEDDQDSGYSFAQKILNAIEQMPKLKSLHLHKTLFDSLDTLALNSASVEKVTITEGYQVSLSSYELTGASITELNIEVRDIRSLNDIHLKTPNVTRFGFAVLDVDTEDDTYDNFRQVLKRSAMQKFASTIEKGLPKLEVLKLFSSDVVCDDFRVKSETLRELVSNVVVFRALEDCPKLTKVNGRYMSY